jgi:hypothetical protein
MLSYTVAAGWRPCRNTPMACLMFCRVQPVTLGRVAQDVRECRRRPVSSRGGVLRRLAGRPQDLIDIDALETMLDIESDEG